MITVAVTGGIGSGKSEVCRLLENRGARVVSADELARRLMVEDDTLRTDLTDKFGKDFYLSDGALNKRFVSELVFGNEGSRQEVNGIVHPHVYAAFRDLVATARRDGVPMVVLESAVLFDVQERPDFDAFVAVQASEAERIERTRTRDGATADQVEQRMRRQLSDTLFAETADFIVVNDGTLGDLEETVAVLYEALLEGATNGANET